MFPDDLIESVRAGDRRALSRAITVAESDPDSVGIQPDTSVPVIGITGPPGVGKSTLVNQMVTILRSRELEVAVLAVDPSSPLTGGALLGDRIRMQDHVTDDGVYIRSMATRGHLGGLSLATRHAIALMSIAGFDHILIETVGVGQSEVEVMGIADPVVLVLAPGWGDQIQADKAGIVEIADVFVINKSDRPGVDALTRAIAETVAAGATERPVLVTNAVTGDGVRELVDLVAGA